MGLAAILSTLYLHAEPSSPNTGVAIRTERTLRSRLMGDDGDDDDDGGDDGGGDDCGDDAGGDDDDGGVCDGVAHHLLTSLPAWTDG